MPLILAGLVQFLGKFLSDKLLMWVAVKTLLLALFMVVLPYVLKTVIVWFMENITTFIASNVQGDAQLHAFTINLTGVGGYLGDCFQLPLCVSIILSACALRLTLNFIPGIR